MKRKKKNKPISWCSSLVLTFILGINAAAQTVPGAPEENGLKPKTDTIYINVPPDDQNNGNVESLGVAIAANGNVLVGWEDDGDGLADFEAIWTLFGPDGTRLTPEADIKSVQPEFAGQTLPSKYRAYFRADKSPVPGRTSWGPKIKANLFGDGLGMGATSFELDLEVAELAAFNAGTTGDFDSVQLLNNDTSPVGIVTGVPASYAARDGDIRIGDWEYLSNGNVVVVGESRQKQDLVDLYGGTAPNTHAIYRLVDKTGAEIKATSMVSETPDTAEIWHGVGVTKNGFGVRFALNGRTAVRLFDNTGKPTTGNLDIANLTTNPSTAAGGRGDGAGFHGNGNDAYVVAASSGTEVWVTVLNADGTVRYSKSVIDDVTLNAPGRLDAAIDAQGRVIVVFSDTSGTAGNAAIVMGRMLDATGKPLGKTFYVSETELPNPATLKGVNPRISWRNGLAAVVWQSNNSPAGPDVTVVAERLFSTFQPGTLESVGLTRIVPDTVIINPGIDKLGNWEPYASVLGNSVFLVEGNTFAENTTDMQRFVVAFQPVAGGAMKLGEGFFADNGTPFKGAINASRQNGNPGRVAGDQRPGAVNFIVGGEASPHTLTEFQSDNRWNLGFDRGADGRYGTVQTFKLDPATLAQTSLSKAFDAVNGRLTSGASANMPEISRFGGDVVALDNGNFVVVVDDRSNAHATDRAATAVIVAPDGSIVKDTFSIDIGQIWANVAAYKGGFAVRVNGIIRFYDNAGNLKGQANQSTSGESFDGGRGDGTRLAGHINSPYVFLVGKVTTGSLVKLAAWDSRNQSFVAVGTVSEPAFAGDFDRANLAVDALNRVAVGWVSKPPGYENQQVAARVMALNETTKTIEGLTASFLPFINAAPTGGVRTLQMSLAMTTKQILVAAKGEINLQNKPELGANSPSEVNFYTVFSSPAPKEDPTTPAGGPNGGALRITSVTRSAGKLNLAWSGTPGTYTIQKKTNLTDATWTDLQTTTTTSASIDTTGASGFIRVVIK